MKKTFYCFIFLLVIGLGTVGWIQFSLLETKDQVTFQDTIHYGEPEMIYGMTIQTDSVFQNKIYWNTSYKAGLDPQISTRYDLTLTSSSSSYHSDNYIYLESDLYNISYDDKNDKIVTPYDNLNSVLQDLYDNLGTNETGKKLIYLKDYYEYYPLCVHFTFEDYSYYYSYTETHYASPHSETDSYSESALAEEYEILRNFFKIPVIEQDQRLLQIQKGTNGIHSIDIQSANGDSDYYLNTLSTDTEDSLYFTFQTTTGHSDGSRYDTSHIPGGYGIYRLPFESKEKAKGQTEYRPLLNELSLVYPLDPTIDLYNLFTTNDNSKLIIAYVKEQKDSSSTIIEIVDTNTFEQLQILTLENIEKEDGSQEILLPYNSYVYDDFFVLGCSSDYLAVFPLGNDGLYTLGYVVDIYENDVFDNYLNLLPRTVMDYKDGKLAVVGQSEVHIREKEGIGYYIYETCGFYVAVFDKNGLQYYSTHESSLDQGLSSLNRSGINWVWPATLYNRYSSYSYVEYRPALHVEWD